MFLFKRHNYFSKGSGGTHFDHGKFEIKTFLIYSPPYFTMGPADQTCSYSINAMALEMVFVDVFVELEV